MNANIFTWHVSEGQNLYLMLTCNCGPTYFRATFERLHYPNVQSVFEPCGAQVCGKRPGVSSPASGLLTYLAPNVEGLELLCVTQILDDQRFMLQELGWALALGNTDKQKQAYAKAVEDFNRDLLEVEKIFLPLKAGLK